MGDYQDWLCILWGDDGDGPAQGAMNRAPTPLPNITRKDAELRIRLIDTPLAVWYTITSAHLHICHKRARNSGAGAE